MLNYMRSGNSFNVVTSTDIYPYVASSKEEADQFNQLLIDVKNGDRSESELVEWLNPGKKFEEEGLIEFKNGRYRIAGTRIPVDDKLAKHVIEFYKKGEDVKGLLNFAKLLYLNPYKYNRQHLYEFIENNGIVVTDQGHLVLYKSVRSLKTVDSQLADFVGKAITKALENGTPTSEVNVYRTLDGDYITDDDRVEFDGCYCGYDDFDSCMEEEDCEFIGTLEEVYNQGVSKDDGVQFTDFHSGTTDIKLGKPVSMPVEQCDPDPQQQCSKGLHAGSFDYVEVFGGGNKTILVVLVNPMNVVAVPYNDKLRTSEYFPVATLDKENGHYKRLNTNIWSDDYLPREAKQLNEIKEEIEVDEFDGGSAYAEAVTTLLQRK
jgi:hypothetical protein